MIFRDQKDRILFVEHSPFPPFPFFLLTLMPLLQMADMLRKCFFSAPSASSAVNIRTLYFIALHATILSRVWKSSSGWIGFEM